MNASHSHHHSHTASWVRRQRRGSVRAVQSTGVDFRVLLELSPDSVVVSDGDGRIIFVNQQTEALFGYRNEDLIAVGIFGR